MRRRKKTDKAEGELAYWRNRLDEEGTLLNGWYEWFYTAYFDLTLEDYRGLRVLDIGCGPRGSLEWADGALERVGLDPVADSYLALGASEHKMSYVQGGAETIPFEDGHFDIVCSFNSLDHVDDVEAVITEIKRVTRHGGLFLLMVDIHREPTPQEPITLEWSVTDRFRPEFSVLKESHFEKADLGMYSAVREGRAYDHTDPTDRYGVVTASLRRQP